MGYLPYQPVQDFFHQQYHGANISNMLGGHDPRLTNRRHLEKAETAPHCLAHSPHLMAPGWLIVSRNFWTRSTRFWHKVLENPHFGAWKSINMHYMFMARQELRSWAPKFHLKLIELVMAGGGLCGVSRSSDCDSLWWFGVGKGWRIQATKDAEEMSLVSCWVYGGRGMRLAESEVESIYIYIHTCICIIWTYINIQHM